MPGATFNTSSSSGSNNGSNGNHNGSGNSNFPAVRKNQMYEKSTKKGKRDNDSDKVSRISRISNSTTVSTNSDQTQRSISQSYTSSSSDELGQQQTSNYSDSQKTTDDNSSSSSNSYFQSEFQSILYYDYQITEILNTPLQNQVQQDHLVWALDHIACLAYENLHWYGLDNHCALWDEEKDFFSRHHDSIVKRLIPEVVRMSESSSFDTEHILQCAVWSSIHLVGSPEKCFLEVWNAIIHGIETNSNGIIETNNNNNAAAATVTSTVTSQQFNYINPNNLSQTIQNYPKASAMTAKVLAGSLSGFQPDSEYRVVQELKQIYDLLKSDNINMFRGVLMSMNNNDINSEIMVSYDRDLSIMLDKIREWDNKYVEWKNDSTSSSSSSSSGGGGPGGNCGLGGSGGFGGQQYQ